MTRLLTTTACIAALSVPVYAASDYKKDTMSDNKTQLENAIENSATAAEQTADEALDATQGIASDVSKATENTFERAADATKDAASSVAETAQNVTDATVEAAQTAAATVEATFDEGMREAAIIFDDSWDADIAELDAPMVKRDGWVESDANAFDYSDLTGMRVYGANDEWIGEIDNVVVDQNDNIVAAVLGVGGFIGIGEKDVLVSFDSITVKEEAEGDEMRAYVDATEEMLEALPAYPSS